MKKKIFIIYDGLTGEIIASCDIDVLGKKAIESIIDYQFEQLCVENGHDMQIRTGYKP